MMSRAFSKREKVLLVILAVLLLVAIYYLGVHRQVIDSLERVAQEENSVATEIMIAQAKADKEQTMKDELEEIRAAGSASYVPDYDNLSKVIVFLNTVLDGTTDYTISFADLSISDGIARRVANLSFTSTSYSASCRIIEQLQNCEFCCRLGDVNLTPIKEFNSSAAYGNYDADYSINRNPLQVSLTMTFYEKAD